MPAQIYTQRFSQASLRCCCRVQTIDAVVLVLQGFPFRSHALLQEAGINLVDIMKEQGFYVRERKMSAPANKRGRNSFGEAAPIELPTAQELATYADKYGPRLLHQYALCPLLMTLCFPFPAWQVVMRVKELADASAFPHVLSWVIATDFSTLYGSPCTLLGCRGTARPIESSCEGSHEPRSMAPCL